MTKKENKCCGVMETKYVIGAIAVLLVGLVLYQSMGSSAPMEPSTFIPAVLNGDGVVKIVEYSDFMCPYCGRAADTIGRIKEFYGDKIDLEYRHFPLDFHKGADKAAEASECARDQGKFWEYHDLLFESYSKGIKIGEVSVMKSLAVKTELDETVFNECLDSGSKKSIIDAQKEEGKTLGVSGTPSFFIEGEKIVGAQPYENFQQVIEAKLGEV